MSLINSLQLELFFMVKIGFTTVIIGLLILGALWKLFGFDKKEKMGYLVYNVINVIIACFILGFIISIPKAYNRITGPYYDQLEEIMVKELKKNKFNPDNIPLTEVKEYLALKKNITKSLHQAVPFAKKELSLLAYDLIPGSAIIENFENEIKEKNSISVAELIDYLKNSVKDKLFFFIPYVTFFLILDLVALFVFTCLAIRNEEKKQIEIKEGLENNKIIL